MMAMDIPASLSRPQTRFDNLSKPSQTSTMTAKAKRVKLSDQVRQAIQDCGETHSQICRATGLDNATLCRFMSGERGLSTTALDTIAEYLELSIVSSRKSAQRK